MNKPTKHATPNMLASEPLSAPAPQPPPSDSTQLADAIYRMLRDRRSSTQLLLEIPCRLELDLGAAKVNEAAKDDPMSPDDAEADDTANEETGAGNAKPTIEGDEARSTKRQQKSLKKVKPGKLKEKPTAKQPRQPKTAALTDAEAVAPQPTYRPPPAPPSAAQVIENIRREKESQLQAKPSSTQSLPQKPETSPPSPAQLRRQQEAALQTKPSSTQPFPPTPPPPEGWRGFPNNQKSNGE